MAPNYKLYLDQLPQHMWNGIINWIEYGIKPGAFLSSILCNDLMSAVFNADWTNMDLLPRYVRWLHNYAPSAAWGSDTKYDMWHIQGGLKAIAPELTVEDMKK